MDEVFRPRFGLNARAVLLAAGLSAALCLPGLALSAQEDVSFSAFYVGRTDSNQDGLVDTNDIALIYGATDEADVPLSDASVSVRSSTIAYDTNGLSMAYTHGAENAISLTMALAGQEPVTVPLSLPLPGRLELHNGLVIVHGANAEQIAEVQVFDPASPAAPIATHTFRSADTASSVSASGTRLMGYNQFTGGLSLFTLPDMAPVDFALAGYASTSPSWSPVDDVFAMGIGMIDNPNDARIVLVDGQTGAVTEFDVPEDFALGTPATIRWSNTGRYVSLDPINDPLTALSVVDVQTGEVVSLRVDGSRLIVQDWAADDSFMLLLAQPSPGDGPELSLMRYTFPDAAPVDLVSPETVDFNSIEWASQSTQVAIVGRAEASGQTGIFVIDAAADTLTPLFETPETDLRGVFWSGDDDSVYFIAPSGDDLFSSEGDPTALYRVSVETGEVVRVSDEGIVVAGYPSRRN
ncbi:MAG: hypothetical protein KME04_11055 [Pleurocapsa minor GSE-CHR-MK-17-07R]|jgi:hypothetical protein|nr:hypothetical protein [Pleurocapsa minor GSE-CHR-MK 17-07R]